MAIVIRASWQWLFEQLSLEFCINEFSCNKLFCLEPFVLAACTDYIVLLSSGFEDMAMVIYPDTSNHIAL